MQCEQIRPYLGQYADGSLPGFKAAWVVQHLAGCTMCAAAADEARRRVRSSPAEAAAARHAPEPALIKRGAPSEAVQRPIPRWLRWATLLLLAAAAGGAVWLFLGAPGQLWLGT